MKLGICLRAVKQVPVTMNEMLLRGCTLRNTGHILGLVVYTGDDSRIQMNAAKTSNKVGEQSATQMPPIRSSALKSSAWFLLSVAAATRVTEYEIRKYEIRNTKIRSILLGGPKNTLRIRFGNFGLGSLLQEGI